VIAAIIPFMFAGCAFDEYQRVPLESTNVVAELVEQRSALSFVRADDVSEGEAEALYLHQAALLLHERNPELRMTRAQYETAAAVAAESTPFPNPKLEFGPEFGFGPDASSPYTVPFLRLGVTIPTAGKRSKQDERNFAAAEALRVNAATRCGELYLELRRKYTRLAVARARVVMHEGIVAAANRSLQASKLLVEAGGADALDVSLFALEHARERARLLESEQRESDAESGLAGMMALDVRKLGALPSRTLAVMPEAGMDVAALRERLGETHPALLRAAAQYELAEKELRLEVAKQYPDIVLGGGLAGETGEDKTLADLSIGFNLPIFDLNQQGIARARAHREEVRTSFEAAADRALGELDRAHRAAELASERHRVLAEEVLPAARNNVDVAYRALPAGSADALQVLDAERSLRQVELEVLDAELQLQLAWSDLELAFGAPLLVFDEEHENETSGAQSADRGEQ